MNKVALIIPYFGKWPEWIELFFYSCGNNPMIDFIFYTDCPLPKHQYGNTIFYSISFDEYKQLVSQRLDIPFRIENAYKLTDLKPFLGALHQQELQGYDFWGFGDLDLVWGDLSMLVNEEMLQRYEMITTHNYHIAGHFTICRNNEYWRFLCFHIPNWQEYLCHHDHQGLDENHWAALVHPWMRHLRLFHKYVTKPLGIHLYKVLDFFNPVISRKRSLKEYWTSPAPNAGQKWIYNIKTGEVINPKGVKLPYLHYLFFKKTPWLDTDFYWREGYWQLPSDFEKFDRIVFDRDKVVGE